MMARPASRHRLLPERMDFLDELAHRVASAPERSAERTRARFMELAARELAKSGGRKLRARTLNQLARTSQGTFYHHFKDGRELEAELWGAFMEHRRSVLGPLLSSRDLFDATHFSVVAFTEHYRANAAIYRAFMPRVDQDARLAAIWDRGNMALVSILADDMVTTEVAGGVPRPLLEAAIMLAYSILDENLYAIYAVKRAARLAATFKDVEAFTEVCALLIHRALFGDVAGNVRLRHAEPLMRLCEAARTFSSRRSAPESAGRKQGGR